MRRRRHRGADPIALIAQLRIDIAVIGSAAVDTDGTLLDFDMREVRAQQAIIERARRVRLVT